jgi:hypothetical protein
MKVPGAATAPLVSQEMQATTWAAEVVVVYRFLAGR